MKLFLSIIPFLGALALADAAADCQAPKLLCETLHPVTCACLNAKALQYYHFCGGPEPRATDCSAPGPIIEGECLAEPLLCSKLHPVTCACQNAVEMNRYRCHGGALPRTKDCAAPKPREAAKEEKKCECEQTFCTMSWPESCYCKNAAAAACVKKCGGVSPKPAVCPPLPSSTLSTTTYPQQTPAAAQICGGGRGSKLPLCAEGFVCAKDPSKPGCGPDCDGFGICVPAVSA